MVTTTLVTIEEVEATPPNLANWELIEGELVNVSPTNIEHAILSARLTKVLANHVDATKIGQVMTSDPGFVVARGPDSLLAPDVAFVSSERLAGMKRLDRFGTISPDLAVEIESPSNTQTELMRKVTLYLAGGTQTVWLVRPGRRTVTVFDRDQPERILTDQETLDGGEVLPGFTLPLSELFA